MTSVIQTNTNCARIQYAVHNGAIVSRGVIHALFLIMQRVVVGRVLHAQLHLGGRFSHKPMSWKGTKDDKTEGRQRSQVPIVSLPTAFA